MKFSPHRSVQILLTLALIGAVSACGQKGKLVLPVRPPAISTPYPQEQPKPAQSQSEQPEQSEQSTTDQPGADIKSDAGDKDKAVSAAPDAKGDLH